LGWSSDLHLEAEALMLFAVMEQNRLLVAAAKLAASVGAAWTEYWLDLWEPYW